MTTFHFRRQFVSKARNVAERVRRSVRQTNDFVDLETAQFLWHHKPNAEGRWLEECLVVLPHTLDQEKITSLGLNELCCSTGADTEGWPHAPENNPSLFFGRVLAMDWLSDQERVEAVAEFAKIRELDWAREILRGMAFEYGALENDEDTSPWQPITSIGVVEIFRDAILAKIA